MRAVRDPVGEVRAFNRFYTNTIGVLREGLLRTPYSLTEARVIFELGQRDATELVELRRRLDIDPGYLSRIVSRFEADGLATRKRSSADARRQVIRLTSRGRRVYRTLDERSASEVEALLSPLHAEEERRLVGAMRAIQSILEDSPEREHFALRSLEPGELGWVVQRHGVLYAREYGWDDSFEGFVAGIVGDYVHERDVKREQAWIAESDGEPVGCVFCVKKSAKVAQLRLLLVEPSARGMGIGTRLVDRCTEFARRTGYDRLMLWTNDVLDDARPIYERAGFELVEQERHHSFGVDLLGQSWWLSLQS
jgi:DNA-binding MarR family transcriptional regulator/predicted GNAT family acetyltransferase